MKELYRGLSPTLIGILPYAGIAFFIRDVLNQVRAHVYVRMNARTPTLTRTCTCVERRMEGWRDIDRQAGRQPEAKDMHEVDSMSTRTRWRRLGTRHRR